MSTVPLLLLLAAPALALSPSGVTNPRQQGRWVSDGADVIDAAAEARLESSLSSLNVDLGVEVAVVTTTGIDREPKDFAGALFSDWGIGRGSSDTGLLILLVQDRRRLEMETGYGLEPVLPDGWLGAMQQRVMVPAFKDGRFGDGLVAGVAEVEGRLRANPEEVRAGTRREGAQAPPRTDAGRRSVRSERDRRDDSAGSSSGFPFVLVGVFGIGGGVLGLQAWRRKQERTCPTCKKEMRLLSEAEEDKHLDDGQEKEEEVGSVQYDVRVCDGCEFVRIIPQVAMFSSYQRCPKCHTRTSLNRQTTLQHATEWRGGLIEVHEKCARCDHEARRTVRTPAIPRVVVVHGGSRRRGGGGFGGGGFGGGSFGGGRSGGGGAGSSW